MTCVKCSIRGSPRARIGTLGTTSQLSMAFPPAPPLGKRSVIHDAKGQRQADLKLKESPTHRVISIGANDGEFTWARTLKRRIVIRAS